MRVFSLLIVLLIFKLLLNSDWRFQLKTLAAVNEMFAVDCYKGFKSCPCCEYKTSPSKSTEGEGHQTGKEICPHRRIAFIEERFQVVRRRDGTGIPSTP